VKGPARHLPRRHDLLRAGDPAYALAWEELFAIGDDGLAFLWASIGLGGIEV
jgi:hypothetical protein